MGEIKISQMHRLKLFLILREALGVSLSNPKFAIASLLPSLPLLCFSVLYFEVLLEQALLQTLQILEHEPHAFPNQNLPLPLGLTRKITRNYCNSLMRLGLFWLVKFHVLELYPMMVIVRTSSELYAGKNSSTVWESIRLPHFRTKLQRVLITSLYVTFFSACFLVGSIWLVAVYTVITRKLGGNILEYIATALYRAGSVGLLSKWLEISAVMNMSMVISILEETYGSEALVLSAHLSSKGSDRTNLLLSAVFFMLVTSSRLICIGDRCDGRSVPAVVQFGFLHLVNVMRWVFFTVSFYRSEEYVKISADGELGKDCKLPEPGN